MIPKKKSNFSESTLNAVAAMKRFPTYKTIAFGVLILLIAVLSFSVTTWTGKIQENSAAIDENSTAINELEVNMAEQKVHLEHIRKGVDSLVKQQ